jgi:hypothetical protein
MRDLRKIQRFCAPHKRRIQARFRSSLNALKIRDNPEAFR